MSPETPSRIQPARLDEPTGPIADTIVELSASAATLGKALHPRTAGNLADLVRIMNTYYSNLIEGHNARPRDIERALAGELDIDEGRRDLQLEAAAHVRVQRKLIAWQVRAYSRRLPRWNLFAGCIVSSIVMLRSRLFSLALRNTL